MFQYLRIASRSAVLTLLAALTLCVPLSAIAAPAASHGDIVVVTVHGTVTATMAGMTVPLSGGAILQLPATVRTGADGAVELRQGPSTFAAAGNTELEIPQSAAADGLIERIVQIRGNAFYSIGKRTGTRLRVETPYLVAVIKGTQFNVAAQEDSTTIALFEGHLEVRATDDSDVVALEAGEIAIRRRNDVSISVLRLNAARGDAHRNNQELAARQQGDSSTSNSSAVTARNDGTSSQPRGDTSAANGRGTPVDGSNSAAGERTPPVDGQVDGGATVTAKAAVDVGSLESPVAARVDTNVGVNVGGVGVDAGVGATVDVGAGSVAATANVGVDVGSSVSADVGVGAAVDLSAGTVAAGASAGVDVGSVSADVGVGAAVDVPAGTASVDLGAAVAAGNVAAVDTSVDRKSVV